MIARTTPWLSGLAAPQALAVAKGGAQSPRKELWNGDSQGDEHYPRHGSVSPLDLAVARHAREPRSRSRPERHGVHDHGFTRLRSRRAARWPPDRRA